MVAGEAGKWSLSHWLSCTSQHGRVCRSNGGHLSYLEFFSCLWKNSCGVVYAAVRTGLQQSQTQTPDLSSGPGLCELGGPRRGPWRGLGLGHTGPGRQ